MRAAASIACVLVTASCVSVRALAPDEPVRLAHGEAMAFGRIRVFESGRALTPWNVDLLEELMQPGDPEIRLALFRVESEERALYPAVGADGWFTWVMPAGTWLVYRTSQDATVRHDVLCAFQVLAGSDAQYLGELELQIEVERDAMLQARGYEVGAVSARLDRDAARVFLDRRRTDVPIDMVERTLVTSPELRGLFDDWDRGRAERVLAGMGFKLLAE